MKTEEYNEIHETIIINLVNNNKHNLFHLNLKYLLIRVLNKVFILFVIYVSKYHNIFIFIIYYIVIVMLIRCT